MRRAAASIELPADAASGAVRFPERGPAGQGIRVRVASGRPAQARVAVEHRGWWYYIADEDETSKLWFQMLQLLAGALTPGAAAGMGPVLTVPVTRR